MQKKQVAVLDVGSSKMTAVVGERGINKTFIVKARRDFEYDGYGGGEFLSVEALKRVLRFCGEFLSSSVRGIETVYVGVPGEFTEVTVRDSQISFPRKKRIDENDVDSLFDAAFVLSSSKSTLINRSAIVYELDDYRRLANPVGETSEILKGKLSFITCRNYFIDLFKPVLKSCGFREIEFVSASLAEAMYLIDAETRDRIAIILDVGYISSTFSLIQGDGIIYQSSFDYGGGYITAALTQRFTIDFPTAEALKRKINLSRVSEDGSEIIPMGTNDYCDADSVRAVIKASLDILCEKVSECIEDSGYMIPEYVPITVTGGGISYLRGAKEHLSGRLGFVVEKAPQKIPVGIRPTEASMYSLLDLTLG